jgi:hypothetical protein
MTAVIEACGVLDDDYSSFEDDYSLYDRMSSTRTIVPYQSLNGSKAQIILSRVVDAMSDHPCFWSYCSIFNSDDELSKRDKLVNCINYLGRSWYIHSTTPVQELICEVVYRILQQISESIHGTIMINDCNQVAISVIGRHLPLKNVVINRMLCYARLINQHYPTMKDYPSMILLTEAESFGTDSFGLDNLRRVKDAIHPKSKLFHARILLMVLARLYKSKMLNHNSARPQLILNSRNLSIDSLISDIYNPYNQYILLIADIQ